MGERLNEALLALIRSLNAPLWDVLIVLLVGVGIFYTCITGAVQVKLFVQSMRVMKTSRAAIKDPHGITPFQAFVTGLASRVGVGNVAGVAIAIAIGGPGAVFWMWLTAFLGMSSAFAESSLAQLFKIRDRRTEQFRGGPAYYIVKGLKKRWMAITFALTLILSYGFIFNAVQANSIISATSHAWGWHGANIFIDLGDHHFEISWIGIVLVILTGLVIFGGIQRIAKVAECFVPLMAILYLIVALYIAIINIAEIPAIFTLIITSAFTYDAASGGFLGGLISLAMIQGIQRGLFSNEAGMGSAPNAAAASDVKHPVNQGLVQMLGVFVDTFIVCSCTAIIILVSDLYHTAGFEGVVLTQMSLEKQIGTFGSDFLAIILFLFAYSSIIGNYAYAESNVQFIHNSRKLLLIFRILVLIMVYLGAITSVPLVWALADFSMGLMATINLIAIILLTPFLRMLLIDYKSQLKKGINDPEFKLDQHPEFKEKVNSDIW